MNLKLQDWFAGKALQSIVTSAPIGTTAEQMAKGAYDIAQAMLQERKERRRRTSQRKERSLASIVGSFLHDVSPDELTALDISKALSIPEEQHHYLRTVLARLSENGSIQRTTLGCYRAAPESKE
jgi:hypothetical protein